MSSINPKGQKDGGDGESKGSNGGGSSGGDNGNTTAGNGSNGGGSGSNGGGNGSNSGGHGQTNNSGGGSASPSPFPLTESDVNLPINTSMYKATMVNDMAPTVSYSANWDFSIVKEPGKPPPGHTYHSTAKSGSFLSFTFIGTQIFAFGLLPPGDAPISANYSMDAGPPESRALEAANGATNLIGNATLYVSPLLPYGSHNISIFVTQTGQGRNYTLDYFQVITPKSPPKPPTNKSNVGAIIGGVLGAFAFILLLALLFFLKRRRRMGQSSFQREHPQMFYYGQSNLSNAEPRNTYPYPFAPTFDSQTSQSRRSWPTSGSNRFPPPSINPPSTSHSAVDDRKSLASLRSIDSAGSWRSPSSTKNSSMEAGVSHFSLYSSRKTVSTMQFREPTPPARPRVPPTLQPLEPVAQGDFDRFTTSSSVRGLGHAL